MKSPSKSSIIAGSIICPLVPTNFAFSKTNLAFICSCVYIDSGLYIVTGAEDLKLICYTKYSYFVGRKMENEINGSSLANAKNVRGSSSANFLGKSFNSFAALDTFIDDRRIECSISRAENTK